jgi:tetratricopeptide (TPR) repeat protein
LNFTSISSFIKRLACLIFVVLLAACSLEKKSGFNRRMQNLTAHYNFLFNARDILDQKQDAYATGFIDDYTEILSVYQDTAATNGEDKDLEAVKTKANYIINFKEQSKYLGDAYLVLGQASYLDKSYFNALEYFNYVLRSYNTNPNLVQETLVWKARTLMKLKQMSEAKLVIDTAILSINPKKKAITADVYATKLQYDISEQEYADGEEMAKQAIQYSRSTMQKLRWTFILSQLQELNKKPADAIAGYSRIVKSNAAFEMAFNADLNRIRMEDQRDGIKISRIDRLRGLLRNENNKEFTDQIYYQIAQIYFTEGDINKAVENYQLSAKYSVKNQNQKGLSYLRLADINFKNKADYVNAKKYYDSTLINLAPTYPGYAIIQKKTENLQLLTDNLNIIAHEDTLQMLARLGEKEREAKLDSMVAQHTLQQQPVAGNSKSRPMMPLNNNPLLDNQQDPQASVPNGNSFYFYNNKSVSQGFAVFKRKWGNRKLEDNWRRSQRSNSNITANTAPANDPDATPGQAEQKQVSNTAGIYRQQLVQDLPLTPELLALSNQRVLNAYTDIGNFYRDIIEDAKEAIATYELILRRFPDNPNKPAIYYSLYRLYSQFDMAKANLYKDRLLKEFADSVYAKVILDPEYGKRLSDADAEFYGLYNQVYDLYAQRQYVEAIKQMDALQAQFPNNKLAAQLYYLRALANGRQVKVTPFKADLQKIVLQYPGDSLVTPLVKQHLAYIDSNSTEMAARRFAILDSDPDYIPFMRGEVKPMVSQFAQVADKKVEKPIEKLKAKPVEKPAEVVKKPEIVTAVKKHADTAVTVKPTEPVITSQPKVDTSVIANQPVEQPEPVVNKPAEVATEPVKPKKTYIFNEADAANYYFVVNVASNTTNLSSSRFGIGQFNRTRYAGADIKHQLKDVGTNQLIYVGRFSSIDVAKSYARAIIPLLPQIMKVPKDKYTFFIITQQNLDKLADAKLLDNYLEYYQDNF